METRPFGGLGAAVSPSAPPVAQSRLAHHCTSLASHAGEISTVEDCLRRILTHLTGGGTPTSGESGAKAVGGTVQVTGLLDDAERWLTRASENAFNAKEMASMIEGLVSK
jgi:hypothetical protein